MRARFRAALAGLLIVAAAATACTGPEVAACGADETGPITFATVKDLNPAQRAELIGRWDAAHPDEPLEVVVLPATADEQRAQLAATLRVGERAGPGRRDRYDVVGFDVVFLAEFARSDFLQPLTENRFSGAGFLKVPWTNSFARDKQLYAVPFTTNVGLLYYRADKLAEMKVIPDPGTRWTPADWQAVRKAARDSLTRPGPAGYLGQLAAYEGLTANTLELVWAEDGELPIPGEPATPEERDRAARGVGFLLDGVRNRWIDPAALGFDEQDSLNAFAGGQGLILRHWPDAWTTLARSGQRVGVTRLPGDQAAVLGGESLAVARCSPYRESARRLISFLTAAEQQRWIFQTGLYLPAVQSLYTDGSLTGDGGLPDEFVRLLHESVNDARGRPADPAWNQTSRIVQTEIHQALTRSATAAVDAGEVVNGIADRLDRMR